MASDPVTVTFHFSAGVSDEAGEILCLSRHKKNRITQELFKEKSVSEILPMMSHVYINLELEILIQHDVFVL